MNISNRISVLIVLTIFLLLGVLITLCVLRSFSTNPLLDADRTDPTTTPETTLSASSDPDHQLTYAGWIPYWGSKEGLNSLKAHADKMNSVSPVWYEVNSDGSLAQKFAANKIEITDYVRTHNIALIPAISMFDHDLFTGILQDPVKFEKHLQAILKEVINNNYEGIDLDYESTKLSDKEKYFQFLEQLSLSLHRQNKKMIVTVIAKWGDDVVYPSLPETRQVQDWKLIGPLVDEVRIMAYDYTYSKSYFPGPIAPLGWVEDILEYALTKLPAAKIVLGVHLYSYEWALLESDNQLDFIIDYLANKQSEKTARSYEYETVKAILKEYQGEASSYQGENVFKYDKTVSGIKEKRVLVYITPEGIAERIDLAKRYGIKGVVFWRLGNDANLF